METSSEQGKCKRIGGAAGHSRWLPGLQAPQESILSVKMGPSQVCHERAEGPSLTADLNLASCIGPDV